MIGKKKSGFQITSVTSEYEGSTGGEGLREPLGGEAEAVVNGGPAVGPSADPELPGKDGRTKPPPATAGQGAAGGEVPKETGTAAAGTLPGTRSPPPPAPSPCGSRFRVVKLDHGLGEPYRRGRWTCVDLYMDRELDAHGLAKALAGSRHVNSLDSHPELGALLAHRAVSQLRPRPHAPKSQGSPLGESLPAPLGTDPLQVLLQAARTLSLDSPPAPQEKGDPAATPHPANQSHGAKAGARETTSPPTNVKQPSSGDQGGLRKFPEPRSASVSPVPPAQDGSPSRRLRALEASAAGSLRFVSPMQTLAKSMLSVGTQPDSDDDSGSSSSMVAIDNKIEQAMDLVKSHLMYAVREEVEVLKEQIKELIDRNNLLERENTLLKSLARPEQLSQLQSQLQSTVSTATGSSGSSPPTSTA
ncbi:TSC22 domain family protein 4-like isoform X2 [Hemiscyllium ocellatum]|uniref:TSC22 domain family protein 4-like isoform X2 n=1 Tax=Hemiscyllium ocellatum TaxID=170820 RepID=UPI00296629F4|nr:TSC22 domain family protein 4-like isoform X2 [Hemiscyllium ocellatum]